MKSVRGGEEALLSAPSDRQVLCLSAAAPCQSLTFISLSLPFLGHSAAVLLFNVEAAVKMLCV